MLSRFVDSIIKEKYAVPDRIAKELQDSIVEIRMLPVSAVISKFNRFVRDLARQSGKMVRIDISGDDSTIDKTLVEALSDPLIYLVRNAIDHLQGRILISSSHAAEGADVSDRRA
ncbi:hypothetical protein [Paenibacillus hexagrammi]|uniref:Histidine kinase n=1 Tax=Paenibacillus hexagrammi TaxID=2908839 RepID=A0ABY3SKN3_9BACL|nr:hypothetical protein [Paenibacillus sp. YPD9-1]UJF34427.1 hypothetical protein L0M14_04315 [Paenibacillus sp. YPD9-1]